MRIAIVNDLSMAVEVLRRVVDSVPAYTVAWIARDGAEAATLCAKDRPDLVLMDMVMPVKDGVEATREIMKNSPCPILVVTARMSANLNQVFEAMGAGALDVVTTPTMGLSGSVAGAAALLGKIETIFALTGPARNGTEVALDGPQRESTAAPSAMPAVVAIGSSTGGPQALAEVFSRVPADCRAAFVVAQHMDVEYVQGLATWLGERSPLPVKLARAGDELSPGTIVLAATKDHLIVNARHRLAYVKEPASTPYRPSVDVLFESLAANGPERGVAALLTGMGRDGAKGLLRLKNRGWHTIAQSQETCIVFGMPKAAIEVGATAQVLPVDLIAGAIMSNVRVTEGTQK